MAALSARGARPDPSRGISFFRRLRHRNEDRRRPRHDLSRPTREIFKCASDLSAGWSAEK
jgi:hypothetical protein